MSEWTCKSVGLRIIELPKSVFPAGMAEDIHFSAHHQSLRKLIIGCMMVIRF